MRGKQRQPPQATDDPPPLGEDRTLPHNLEAERSILGAILVHNDAYEQVAATLTPQHFYRDAHQRIFKAIHTLAERKVSIDFVTLREELSRAGDLEEVGGPAYVASLADGVPRSTNTSHYASIVKEKATLRAIIQAANQTLTAAYAAEDASVEILTRTDQALLALQNGHGTSNLTDMRQSAGTLYQWIEHRSAHRGELIGIDTGFANLNELTLGWESGDLIVIAARPSIGKTLLAINTAVAATKATQSVAFFSLEMRRRQLENRLVASLAQVDAARIRSGYLGDQDMQKLGLAMSDIHNLPLYIDDRSGQTVQEIRLACRRMRSEHGLGLVIIDYVQLIHGSLDRRGATRNEEITDISRRLKILADELSCPVILLSQLKRLDRKSGDPRPKLDDLRESGALEQDADIVGLLHRKDHRAGGRTELIIAKQRNGPAGTVLLSLDRDTQTFTPMDDTPEPEAEAAAPTRKRRH